VTTKPVPQLQESDYARFSELLLTRCGLYFSEKRRSELELGIRHAFAASTCTSLDEYYDLLRNAQEGAMEMDRLINAVTVSESHFFRDAAQFAALYQQVLPAIIERRRPLRTLRLWSAGCASGEEPYSLAMLLRELLPDVDEWAITILGTDINTEALDRARKGIYGEWAFREELAKQWRSRYFQAHGNRYELKPEVRRMVTFARLNLAEASYPSYETNTTYMDLILCRNVTIYFQEAVTQEVVNRFYDALVDGGWLVVGHSEPSLATYRRFQVRNFPDTIFYQRTGQPVVPPGEREWLAVSERKPRLPQVAPVPPAVITPPVQPADILPPPPLPAETDPYEQARELLEYGHSEAARDLLLNLTKSRPHHAPTCALLGQAYANLGDWTEAEYWCRRAIRFDKLSLEAYYTLSLVYQHQGKLDQAIEAMKKVVYIDRNYVLGHFGLANLYRDNQQLPQALKSLDNTRRLLESYADDAIIPGSGGITAGRLREAVTRQQQQDIKPET